RKSASHLRAQTRNSRVTNAGFTRSLPNDCGEGASDVRAPIGCRDGPRILRTTDRAVAFAGMSNRPLHIRNVVLASHLVMMGFGHWLPNDPRGSGSTEVHKPELRDLGDIQPSRKQDQPTREELRAF